MPYAQHTYLSNGKMQVLCRNKTKCNLSSWSEDQGKTWSKIDATELSQTLHSGTDAVTLKDNRQLLIYKITPQKRGEETKRGENEINFWPISDDWQLIKARHGPLENVPPKQEFLTRALFKQRWLWCIITYTY